MVSPGGRNVMYRFKRSQHILHIQIYSAYVAVKYKCYLHVFGVFKSNVTFATFLQQPRYKLCYLGTTALGRETHLLL